MIGIFFLGLPYTIRCPALPNIINIKEAENKVQKRCSSGPKHSSCKHEILPGVVCYRFKDEHRNRFVSLAKNVRTRSNTGVGGGQSKRHGDVVSSFSNLGLTTSVLHPGRGHAIDQAVSCRTITADVLVQSQASPYGICGWQSDTGTGFSPNTSVSPCQYYSTNANAPHSFIYYRRYTIIVIDSVR
jgi:hypothetical protein